MLSLSPENRSGAILARREMPSERESKEKELETLIWRLRRVSARASILEVPEEASALAAPRPLVPEAPLEMTERA